MTYEKVREVALSDSRLAASVRAAFLLSIVLVSPMFFAQPVTGVFVNAALVLAALLFGLRKEAILVAVAPSLVALVRGQLPAAFLPIVPFIMTGNIILVAGFHVTYRKYGNFLLAAGLGSFLKSAFLFSVAVAFSMTLFAGSPLSAKVMTMFGILQLGTALGGSAIAYLLSRFLGLSSDRIETE